MRPNDVYAVFGGSPSFAFSDLKVKITKSGKDCQLRHTWYSLRPMCPKFVVPFWHPFKRKKQIFEDKRISGQENSKNGRSWQNYYRKNTTR